MPWTANRLVCLDFEARPNRVLFATPPNFLVANVRA